MTVKETAKPAVKAALKPASDEMQVEKSQESIVKDIQATLQLVVKSVESLESRFANRALRGTAAYRHLLTAELLQESIEKNLSDESIGGVFANGLGLKALKLTPGKTPKPEVEIFLGLLVVTFLSDRKQFQKGAAVAKDLLERVKSLNRRTLDPMAAKLFFFFSYFHDSIDSFPSIQTFIISSHRTAALRQDNDTQATLLNIILKNYLNLNLIDQADKLISKAVFPDTVFKMIDQIGRIKAIQLDYSESYRNLLQAIRKAPQTVISAGFQQAAHKLAVIVQLLMGEIPERSLFLQETIRTALVPYLKITQAVREGDLAKFQQALATYSDVYHADKNMTLILRLRHNVIKAGVRRISTSYSRISLKDVCVKLHLDSEEDAEYIIAKAICDGVIDATIDHRNGTVKSNEVLDIYSTSEPQQVFHQRINFCLDLHNESVQALRFPNSSIQKDLKKVAQLAEEERDVAAKIQNNEMDDEDEDMM